MIPDPATAKTTLEGYLDEWADGAPLRVAIANTIMILAETSMTVSRLASRGPLVQSLHDVVGDNADGDPQLGLDVMSNELFLAALRNAPVAAVASEESEGVVLMQAGAPLAVAIDPLDGTSNVDANVSIGSIFSILPMPEGDAGAELGALLQPGRAQLAAGFMIYGPRTAFVLSVGDGTHVFTLDHENSVLWMTKRGVQIPSGRKEYAINASNYWHWDEPVRAYIDECVAGEVGPAGAEFNMRWIASLVAEAFRILARGGIFLYPSDARPGYQNGRLRLVYEANPIAFLVEQAGGEATDGRTRILEVEPQRLHQRVPFIFGARDKVDRLRHYYQTPASGGERSRLFGSRGLFGQ